MTTTHPVIPDPFYIPKGPVGEYAGVGCNMIVGCTHGCRYCYGPASTWRTRDDYARPYIRRDILSKVERAAKRFDPGPDRPRIVFLSFVSDVFQPLAIKSGITAKTIAILHKYDISVRLLTKAGLSAVEPFLADLWPSDEVGVTLTLNNNEDSALWEPNAPLFTDRIALVGAAHDRGITTWASFEPILFPDQSLALLRAARPYLDRAAFGLLSHENRLPDELRARLPSDVNWLDAVSRIYELCHEYGVRCYFKASLREAVG